MLLTMVGDESHDEREERVFAIAAIMAPEDIWAAAEPWWNELMEGQVFHGARFETEFAHDKTSDRHQQRLARYGELARMLATTGVMGVGVGMDVAGAKEAFPDALRESSYLKCFSEVVGSMVNRVHAW